MGTGRVGARREAGGRRYGHSVTSSFQKMLTYIVCFCCQGTSATSCPRPSPARPCAGSSHGAGAWPGSPSTGASSSPSPGHSFCSPSAPSFSGPGDKAALQPLRLQGHRHPPNIRLPAIVLPTVADGERLFIGQMSSFALNHAIDLNL